MKMELYYAKRKNSLLYYAIIFLCASAAGIYFLFTSNIVQLPSNEVAVADNEEIQEQENIKIEKKVFGQSAQGRSIEGYEIGSGEDGILMFAAIHGNEMGTADLLNRLMLEIALNPDLVSKTKKLIIIPILNPDGYMERSDKLNAGGVNLNLNFATSDWQQYGPEGNYAGPAPFSESESRAIKEIVEKYMPRVMISFHSMGNLLSPESNRLSEALAKWYSKKTGYEYYDKWNYPGTATKWFVETTGNPAITVEISKDFQSDWDINKDALLELISSDSWPDRSE